MAMVAEARGTKRRATFFARPAVAAFAALRTRRFVDPSLSGTYVQCLGALNTEQACTHFCHEYLISLQRAITPVRVRNTPHGAESLHLTSATATPPALEGRESHFIQQ